MLIRRAVLADAESLARLRFEFRSALGKLRESETEFFTRCHAWMRERLAGADWAAWVAEQEGELVGCVWVHRMEKMPNPVSESEWHGYVTNFYVREAARGSGIGSRLLQTALDWCRTGRVDAMILWPTERSRPLYLRHGFEVPCDLLELRERSH
jgi:GNAT superfamily N-acetyltransferase